ncbi:Xaa-Pro peptidase family protein [Adlercreutzia sp. ZJ154]|uniref:M24 family metallopeptidase n=1 Tax=Adlercreutzia sp. ZJ154 TaxID=2709790 RepID=UPI001F14A3E0|nr:Xaa-Pro peptidase family protein [Adlercreutzia sp. ZJ154]
MKKRIKKLQKICRKQHLDTFYVRDTSNIAWLTGFQGVFDDERAHAAFISTSDKKAHLHTDTRYLLAAKKQQAKSGFKIDAKRISFSEWANRRWKKAGAIKNSYLGIEDSISLEEYRKIERTIGHKYLRETHDVILELRSVKDNSELAYMREAQSITDEAFQLIADQMAPGMTEIEVARLLDDIMFKLGADALAFPTIVACGENGASPHAQPGNTKMEAGMCVVMDFGAKKHGYCSDMTRTVFLGQPSGKMLRAWEVLRSANEQVESMLKAGVTGKQAHELAEDILAAGGFKGCMGHALGHGVGLDIHELPVLSIRNSRPLCSGNVVTVEPGIYIPGEFGMRLEDMGVIGTDGFDVLTATPHEMVVL